MCCPPDGQGLLAVRQSGLAGTPADAEGALGKVERVLSDAPSAVQEAVVLASTALGTGPAATLIGALREAAHRRRVRLRYRAARGEETAREVGVSGVVCREGAGDAVGFDHLRAEMRTFRVDRVRDTRVRAETVVPAAACEPLAYRE